MTDEIFNTLLAVALMCQSHFSGGLIINGLPHPDKFDQGFEQCATVIKAVEAEKANRAAKEAAHANALALTRLANALNALNGKRFIAEPAPPPQKSPFYFDCMLPASGTPR